MNKTPIFLIVISLLGFAAKSQSRFGLKAGANLANQVKTISVPQVPATTQDTKPFVGYQLGIFYKTNLHRHFSLSAETNFSVIGSGMTMIDTDLKSYDTKEKLGYIEVPLILQYSIHKFYIGAGPGIGFKLFSKLKNFENRTFDLTYYRTIDAAGNLLAGFAVTTKLDVNVRYSHGLMNIIENPGYATTKNRFLNLSVLYALK